MKLNEIPVPTDNLTDNSVDSRAFRQFLSKQGDNLEVYARWLVEASSLSGTRKHNVLQDLINTVATKAGFRVEPGTYVRSDASGITFDGFWQCTSGNVFLVYNYSNEPPKVTPEEVSKILARLNTKKQKEAGVVIHAVFFVSGVGLDLFEKNLSLDSLLNKVTILTYEDFFGILAVQEDLNLDFGFIEKLLLPASPFRLSNRLPIVEYLVSHLLSASNDQTTDSISASQKNDEIKGTESVPLPVASADKGSLIAEKVSLNKRSGEDTGSHEVQRIELKPKTPAVVDTKTLIKQGKTLFEQGQTDESLAHFLKIGQSTPSAGEAQLYTGVILYSKSRYGEAIPYLQQASQLEMPSPNTQLMLGQAYLEVNSHEEATIEFSKGLDIDPEFSELLIGLGSALTELGRFDEALPHLDKALTIDPSSIEGHRAHGQLYEKIGDYNKAIDSFTSGLMVDSEDADFYFQIGKIYDHLRRKESSIEAYENAVNLAPRQWEYLIHLGAAHYEANNWGASIEAYQRALAINPNYGEAYASIGNAFLSIGERDEAIGNFRRALELKPHLNDTRLSLAKLLAETGQTNDAIEIYESLIQTRPNDMAVLIPLVKLHVSLGHYDKVEAICQQQVANGNDSVDIAVLRGTALFRSGDTENAIGLLEGLIEGAPDNPELFFELGNCYISLHKLDYAIEAFEEALKANPVFVDANIKLAEAYALDGKKALAILNYTKVLNLSPDNKEAREGLLMLG